MPKGRHLQLVRFPDPRLRKKAEKVIDFDGLHSIIPDMRKIMRKQDGVAIAANQVGLTGSFFVTEKDVFVNPSFYPSVDAKQVLMQEGCLSIPGLTLLVPRWNMIEVEYQDEEGKSHVGTLEGFEAHVFQHETDHLNGIVMVDYIRG